MLALKATPTNNAIVTREVSQSPDLLSGWFAGGLDWVFKQKEMAEVPDEAVELLVRWSALARSAQALPKDVAKVDLVAAAHECYSNMQAFEKSGTSAADRAKADPSRRLLGVAKRSAGSVAQCAATLLSLGIEGFEKVSSIGDKCFEKVRKHYEEHLAALRDEAEGIFKNLEDMAGGAADGGSWKDPGVLDEDCDWDALTARAEEEDSLLCMDPKRLTSLISQLDGKRAGLVATLQEHSAVVTVGCKERALTLDSEAKDLLLLARTTLSEACLLEVFLDSDASLGTVKAECQKQRDYLAKHDIHESSLHPLVEQRMKKGLIFKKYVCSGGIGPSHCSAMARSGSTVSARLGRRALCRRRAGTIKERFGRIWLVAFMARWVLCRVCGMLSYKQLVEVRGEFADA